LIRKQGKDKKDETQVEDKQNVQKEDQEQAFENCHLSITKKTEKFKF
jgi:hypothetical protein